MPIDDEDDLDDRAYIPNVDAISVALRGKPASYFEGLPDGIYMPTDEERRDPVLLKRYIVFLAMPRTRTIKSLCVALDRYFPWLAVNFRMIAQNSSDGRWQERAAAWDASVGLAALPIVFADQVEAIRGAQDRHIEDARSLASLVHADVNLLLKWNLAGRPKEKKPETYFSAMSLPSAMNAAQVMERRARGMDLADQVLAGTLVSAKQHAILAEQHERALAAIPDETVRETIRKETGTRLLEAEGSKR